MATRVNGLLGNYQASQVNYYYLLLGTRGVRSCATILRTPSAHHDCFGELRSLEDKLGGRTRHPSYGVHRRV